MADEILNGNINGKKINTILNAQAVNSKFYVGEKGEKGDKGDTGPSGFPSLETVSSTGAITMTLAPNTCYQMLSGGVSSFTFTYGTPTESGKVAEYMFEILVDEDPVNVYFPSGTKWVSTAGVTISSTYITLQGKRTYQVSIANNIGLVVGVENVSLATTTPTLSGDTLSWTIVPNAESYKVTANSEVVATTTSTSIDLSEVITQTGSYAVRVIALAPTYSDSESESVTYLVTEQLATPTNVAINSTGSMTWDTVTNASLYAVTCVETSSTAVATTNVYDVTQFTLTAGTTYTFTVKARSTFSYYLESEASAGVTYTA